MSNLRLKSKGFSFAELIISIVILSVGLVSVLRAISLCARATGVTSDMAYAIYITEDKLQELESKEDLLANEPKEKEGVQGKFSWSYTLNLDNLLNLYTLDFGIKWSRVNREDSLNLKTYLR